MFDMCCAPRVEDSPVKRSAVGSSGDAAATVGVGWFFENGGYFTVAQIVPGGPAAQSGRVHSGDTLLAVNGQRPLDTAGLRSLVTGAEGSTVTLTLRSKLGGPENQVTLTRRVLGSGNESRTGFAAKPAARLSQQQINDGFATSSYQARPAATTAYSGSYTASTAPYNNNNTSISHTSYQSELQPVSASQWVSHIQPAAGSSVSPAGSFVPARPEGSSYLGVGGGSASVPYTPSVQRERLEYTPAATPALSHYGNYAGSGYEPTVPMSAPVPQPPSSGYSGAPPPPPQTQPQQQQQQQQQAGGTETVYGVGINFYRSSDGNFCIESMCCGYPATSILAHHDMLVAIDGHNVEGAEPQHVLPMMRGQQGTTCDLTFKRRNGETIDITLARYYAIM